MSADQAQLFQARIGESPTAPLVGPHAMCNHAGQRALGIDQTRTPGLGVQHPLLSAALVGCGKAKGLLHAASEILLGKPLRPFLSNRGERCCAQQRHE